MVRGPGLFFLGSILVVLPACSSDVFVPGDGGDEAGVDVDADAGRADAPDDAPDLPDVIETDGSTNDGGELRFCLANTAGFFCDDFDDPTEINPWSKWSTASPAASSQYFNFVAGFGGQGVEAAANLGHAYLEEQVQGNTLHGIVVRLRLGAKPGSQTLLQVQAGGSTFKLGTDLTGSNFTGQGDSGSATNIAATDTNWHRWDVTFVSGQAQVAEDGASKLAVSFSPSSVSQATIDVGIVTYATGAKLSIDNVLLE